MENIKAIRIGNIYGEQYGTGFAGNVYSVQGLSPCIKCESGGGNRVPLIIVNGNNFDNRRNTETPSEEN